MKDERLIDNDQLNRIIRYNNAYQTIRITMLLQHIEAQADEIERLREFIELLNEEELLAHGITP